MSDLIRVGALGVTVGIDAHETLAPAIRTAWSRARVDRPADVRVSARDVHPGALSKLSGDVTFAAIDQRAGELWMLHAAGLCDVATGRTVALVGAARAGKTSVVAALAHRFGYVTDETVGVAADGSIERYAKPLSLIENGVYPKVQRSPDELGLAYAPERLNLAAVVLLHRDGTQGAALEPVRRAAALPLLAEHSSYLRRFDRPLHRLATTLESVPVFEGHYAEAATLEPLVADLLEAR